MTSEEARDRFSAAIDGELDGDAQRAFEEALARDAELAGEFEEFRVLLEETRSLGADDLPAPDLLDGVQKKLRERSRGRFFRDRFAGDSRTLLPVLLAGTMLLLVTVTWFMVHYVQVEAMPRAPEQVEGVQP